MALTLRTVKGSRLTHSELDNNFIWLRGRDIVDMNVVGNELVLTKDNSNTLSVSISGFTGGGLSGDTYVTGATLNGTILDLGRNDGGVVSVDLNTLPGISASTYTNLNPTPTTIGGIPSGSSFSAQTMQQMWDALLYPYQTPSFTSFSRTSINSVYELGQSVVGGTQTFNWSTSNSSNVSPNTVSIIENHSSTTLLTSSANDGNESLSTTSYSRTTPGSTTLYTITANNTQSGSLSSTISRNWRGRWYYGTNSNTSINVSIITGGTFTTTLTNGVVNNYVTLAPSGAEYGYLVIPNYLTQPTDLRDSVGGCFGTNIPFVSQGTLTFNNAYGVSQTYNIYRTVNAFNTSTNAWLCS